MTSIFESYWAAMFELLGWDYERRPAPFEGWQPDFMLCGSRSVYVAVVPLWECPEKAMAYIDKSDCPYEALIVTEAAPVPDVNGHDYKYALGWARVRNGSGWTWQPAQIDKAGRKVILQHHHNGLRGLTETPTDKRKAGDYIQRQWEIAKETVTGDVLTVDPDIYHKEKDFQRCMVEILSPECFVYTRVRGRHDAEKGVKRIDLIILPRDLSRWKDPQVIFGVEIKNRAALNQTNKVMKWLGQCADYAQTPWEYSEDGETWHDAGYIYVFACPDLIGALPGSDVLLRYFDGTFTRMMAQLGVGELKLTKRGGWSLVKNGDHIIWSQINGVEDGRKDSLQRRFGSR